MGHTERCCTGFDFPRTNQVDRGQPTRQHRRWLTTQRTAGRRCTTLLRPVSAPDTDRCLPTAARWRALLCQTDRMAGLFTFTFLSWGFACVMVLILGLQQDLHRRTARFKRVQEALIGHQVRRAQNTAAGDDAFLHWTQFGRMPRRHWELLLRFRARWLQTKHNPFDVQHVRMLQLMVTERGELHLRLLYESALSRLGAVNQATSRYGHEPLSPADLSHEANDNQHLVFKLPGPGHYLIVEPTEPRRRWTQAPDHSVPNPFSAVTVPFGPSGGKPVQLPSLSMGGPQLEWY